MSIRVATAFTLNGRSYQVGTIVDSSDVAYSAGGAQAFLETVPAPETSILTSDLDAAATALADTAADAAFSSLAGGVQTEVTASAAALAAY